MQAQAIPQDIQTGRASPLPRARSGIAPLWVDRAQEALAHPAITLCHYASNGFQIPPLVLVRRTGNSYDSGGVPYLKSFIEHRSKKTLGRALTMQEENLALEQGSLSYSSSAKALFIIIAPCRDPRNTRRRGEHEPDEGTAG